MTLRAAIVAPLAEAEGVLTAATTADTTAAEQAVAELVNCAAVMPPSCCVTLTKV
jgi:hypothetical protein